MKLQCKVLFFPISLNFFLPRNRIFSLHLLFKLILTCPNSYLLRREQTFSLKDNSLTMRHYIKEFGEVNYYSIFTTPTLSANSSNKFII